MGALVAIAVGFLAGAWASALGASVPFAWVTCVAVLGLGLMLAVSVRRSAVRPGKRAWPVFAALAALTGQAMASPVPETGSIPSGVARIEGTVLTTRWDDSPATVIELREGVLLEEDRQLPVGARLELRGLDAPAGTEVRALARVRGVTRFHNPTPHPDWHNANEVDGRGRLLGSAQLRREAPMWARASHWLRGVLRRRLGETLSPTGAGLARALLLGETRALDRADRERVRDAGLSHVLAVSGLHVTLLVGALVLAIRWLILRRASLASRVDPGRAAKALGIPLALGYAWLVGDAPSAWRAAVTAAIAWGLAAAGRRAHPVAVTAGAAVVLGILRPDDLGRPGFVLSIVATAALVSDLEVSDLGVSDLGVSQATEGARSFVRAGLVVGARTMLATAPVILWLFGDVPLVGLLANLVIVPVAAGLLLPVIAVHAVFALLLAPLASLSGPLVDGLGRAFFASCEVFATIPIGRDLPPPDLLQGILIACGCGALLVVRSHRWRLLTLLLVVLFVGGAEWRLRRAERPIGALRATFLDVGQGDGALIDLPDGRLMVVDAGGAANGGPDPGERVLVPLLRARRRSRIDVLVLSHPHPDHYGGLEALLGAFEVGEIWDSGQAEVEQPEGPVTTLLTDARGRGVPVRHPPELCHRTHNFGEAVARVRWPCPDFDAGWGPNDNSIVVELRMGRRRLLLTGDAEAHAEASMLEGPLAAVDVLKVGHHGSRTSSGLPFIDRLRPRVAIVSAGRENRFGHPHPEVWSRLQRRAECAYRTDTHGGVTVWTDGDRLDVSSTRADPGCSLGPRKERRGR